MEFPCILTLLIRPVVLNVGLSAEGTALRSSIALLIQLLLADFVELLFQSSFFNSPLDSQRPFSQRRSVHGLNGFKHICIKEVLPCLFANLTYPIPIPWKVCLSLMTLTLMISPTEVKCVRTSSSLTSRGRLPMKMVVS